MALASLAVRTTNLTIAQASLQIRAAATVRPRILGVVVVQAAATAQSLGLGVPQALAVTPGTSTLLQRDDPADPACTTNIDLTWGTSPTVPLTFRARWNSAATLGVGILWSFPRGLGIAAAGAMVVWNITAAQASDVNVSIDE